MYVEFHDVSLEMKILETFVVTTFTTELRKICLFHGQYSNNSSQGFLSCTRILVERDYRAANIGLVVLIFRQGTQIQS